MKHAPTLLTVQDGFRHITGALDGAAQRALLADIRRIMAEAPLFVPRMPRTGQPFSVRMTNCGPLGWVSDKEQGYRYQATHPDTGRPWPPIPRALIALWDRYAGFAGPPEACLVNYYDSSARMGSHQDRDEQELRAPVLSVSLGDEAVFHIGGVKRTERRTRVTLRSGDVAVLGGPLRLAYHGIDRVIAGSSSLIAEGGRINLTLRRVTPFRG